MTLLHLNWLGEVEINITVPELIENNITAQELGRK